MLLADFDALTFDCYGTLIDWESGMVESLKDLSDRYYGAFNSSLAS
jgi:2-haloacid dehalogenase